MKLAHAALLFACLAMLACSNLSTSSEDRLKAVAAEIATAAGVAAAQVALSAAEAELAKLEARPIDADPLKQLAIQTSIATARELVTKARAKVASFASGK